MNLKIEQLPIEQLTPYAHNTRAHHAEDISQIARSIERYGFNDPIAVWSDKNIIVEGHGRLMAAKSLGMTTVPVIRLDHLTDEQRREYGIMHNKTAELSGWDWEQLEHELDELRGLDLSLYNFGFDAELSETAETAQKDADTAEDEAPEPDTTEDEAPEVDEECAPTTKPGDIWQLGAHRLMCGDSTNAADVAALMGGRQADLVFTDPPYGMRKESQGVLNDNLNHDDLLAFNRRWIPLTFDVLKATGSWYCWGTDEPLMDIYSDILKPMQRRNEITFRNLITWDKGDAQGQKSETHRMYPIADEKCLFVMCGVQGSNTNSDHYYEGWEPIRAYLEKEWRKISPKNDWDNYLGNQMGKHYFTKSQWLFPTEEQYRKLQALGAECGAFKREYEEIKREYYATRAYFNNTHDNMNSVWHFKRTTAAERVYTGGHATPKPIALCGRAIKSSSRPGEIVLDVFGGSGSTLIACEQLGRVCCMMELSPRYCDVIVKRWETLTGKKARRAV